MVNSFFSMRMRPFIRHNPYLKANFQGIFWGKSKALPIFRHILDNIAAAANSN